MLNEMPEILESVNVGEKSLKVKNYYCGSCGDSFQLPDQFEYLAKPKIGLRLYVHVTDQCNAACQFCRRRTETPTDSIVDPYQFERKLAIIAPHVSSIAFTGGEPLIYPELTDKLIGIASSMLDSETEIDLVTNGSNLDKLMRFKNIDRITSVHISRHRANDVDNNSLFSIRTATASELSEAIQRLNDPGKIVLNCVMQSGGVKTESDVADYLDFAISIGVKNTSFIGMFKANQYCIDHYVNPWNLSFFSEHGLEKWNEDHPDRQIEIWNRHADHDWCKCLTGSYENSKGKTRFYFRGPGNAPKPHYCRQFVYTSDNQVKDGFGPYSQVLL